MKSKKTNFKKSQRSSFNNFEEKDGLKPVKSKSGKSNKRISIYDDLDDDEDINFDMDDFSYKETDFEYEDNIYEDDDDY